MKLIKSLLNSKSALLKLLNHSGVNVDNDLLNEELEKHPDYPSLLAVCDVLTAFNIENSACRVSCEELSDVPCPFLAHVKTDDGDLVMVTRVHGNNIYVSSEKWTNHKLSIESFKKMFTGVVLTIEPPEEQMIAKTLSHTLKPLKTPVAAAGVMLIFIAALIFHTGYFANLSWQLLSLTTFKSVGLITAILLLVQSIDSNNPLVQALCQSEGKIDCNAILSSKAATVFEGLTWSEVGFFYFASTWLILLFGDRSAPIWQTLAILNFVSLPYTIYSIYYQVRVARQWCVLCCTVQALLWLEFIPLVSAVNNKSFVFGQGWDMAAATTLFICLFIPVILWIILKPLLLKIQQLQPLKHQLRKFKYNTELFNKMLTAQPKYALPDKEWSIVLGNAEADNIFTIVTSPYCQPCAKMHKVLEEFLDQNGDIQARVVFTAQNNDKDRNTPISRHFMALYELCDKTVVKNALHDWYEQKQKNYEAWAKTYPVKLNEAEFYKLDKQRAWCSLAEVSGTPTLLLNGYRLPQLYQLPDLKYMLQ
jgi:uncharacterized membrane protein/protein-disulfide isomerase